MNFKKYLKDLIIIFIFISIIFTIVFCIINITSQREIFTKNFTRFNISFREIKPIKTLDIKINKDLDDLEMENFHIYKYQLNKDDYNIIKNQLSKNNNLIYYNSYEFKNKDLFQNFSKLLKRKYKNEFNYIFENSPEFYTLFLSNEFSYYYNLVILPEDKNIIYFVN